MKKNNFTIVLLSLVAALILHISINNLLPKSISSKFILSGHLLLGVFIYGVLAILEIVKKQLPEKFGMAFLAAILLKMFVAILFIMLFIKGKQNSLILVYHFMVIYFYYLILEVLLALQILNKPKN